MTDLESLSSWTRAEVKATWVQSSGVGAAPPLPPFKRKVHTLAASATLSTHSMQWPTRLKPMFHASRDALTLWDGIMF